MTDTRNLIHSHSGGNLQAPTRNKEFSYFIETYIVQSFKIEKNIGSYIATLFAVLRVENEFTTCVFFPVRLIVFWVGFEILAVWL
jgi:hypothetical protein